MKNIIGFTNKFYTLWNYEAVTQYRTNAYGNHIAVGIDHKYYFIKNISFDIEKVKTLHPGVEIDMGLRGKSSFTRNEKLDLPAGYFWSGKYYGKLIDEIIETDLQYCIWSAKNYSPAADYIISHPKYIAHFEAIERENKLALEQAQTLKVGDVVELEFTSNGYNADENYTECWASAWYNDIEIEVCCNGVKRVNSIYPYLMPKINGKAQRTKNKTIKVKVTEVFDTYLLPNNGGVTQQIKVA